MRGVSPVVATILMVAIAIAAAVVAYSWFSSVQAGVQSTAAQGAGTVGKVVPQILSAKCADVNDVNIVLYNPGNADFSETANARVIYGSVDKLVSASLSVPAGGTQTLTLDTDLNAAGEPCTSGNSITIEIYTSAGTIKYEGKLG